MFSIDGRVEVVPALMSALIFRRSVVGIPICLGASVAVKEKWMSVMMVASSSRSALYRST